MSSDCRALDSEHGRTAEHQSAPSSSTHCSRAIGGAIGTAPAEQQGLDNGFNRCVTIKIETHPLQLGPNAQS